MKTLTRIVIVGCLFNLTVAQQHDAGNLEASFDKLLSAQFKSDEPGATVLIARNGRIMYHKAFGMANLELDVPMQKDNVFWIASIGKQFTAMAILRLMEQGKLNVRDDITKFIPDYPAQGNTITIEHLLTHTSGIHNFSGMKDPEKKLALDCTPNEVIDFFKNLPMRFAPGTRWEYSNSGYFLLGYIIENIAGESYAEYLEENFFKPLGMSNSLYASDTRIIKNRVGAYSQGEHGFTNSAPRNITHVFSAGAVQSTVEDLFKWHRAVHSYKLVKKETLDKALRRYKLADGKEADYGYGWRLGYVYESPSLWHGGLISGFGTVEMYLPEEDVYVAVFSNCDCNYPADIASRLAALAMGKPSEYKEILLDNSTLQEYAGVYENPVGQQRIITVLENQLYSQLGRGPKSRLKAYQTDMFFLEQDAMVTMEFSRNGKKEIETLVTKRPKGNEVWSKTHRPMPSENGISVDGKILETYVGEYEIPSVFTFAVTKEQGRLFLQGAGQDKIEMFADTESTFFVKVNDAQLEFVKDDAGRITKAILNQGGRQAEAKKTK